MTTLRGADLETVRDAIRRGDPLPGTAGFAGRVDAADWPAAASGTPARDALVRDVLGRQPLFSEGTDASAETAPPAWSFDPTDLDDPEPVPAGDARAPAGDTELWSLPAPPPAPASEALDAVRQAVLTSVREPAVEGLAVAFSGGVDSGLVAAGVPDAPCYVAGFEGATPHDVEAARAAADAMGRDLRVVAFDHADIERGAAALARALGRTNAMDIAIALPLYFTAEQAAADGFDRLAVGQGADELFGGYAKVADPAEDARVEADTVRGATREVVATLPDQLERDVLALRAAGVEPVAPFLHDRVVSAALRLPESVLATEHERKIALRRVAADVLPASVASAEKKAVQYGTYAMRELDRLARQAGFKRRMDDHVQQYVESLLA